MINNRIIIAVGNALLPYLKDNLTDAELGTAAHDAVAALKAVEKSTDTSPRSQSETGGGAFERGAMTMRYRIELRVLRDKDLTPDDRLFESPDQQAEAIRALPLPTEPTP